MAFCAPALEKFHGLCEEFGMTPGCLAAAFALSLPGISSLVIGCRSEKQIISTVQQVEEAKELSAEQMQRIHSVFLDIDERVITPTLW